MTLWIIKVLALEAVLLPLAFWLHRICHRRLKAKIERRSRALKALQANNRAWQDEMALAWTAFSEGDQCEHHMRRLNVFAARSRELHEMAGVKPLK